MLDPELTRSRQDASFDRLVVVADDPGFLEVFRRACDVAYEGDCAECRAAQLDSTLRTARPSVVIVHADGFHDRGRSVVARVRSRTGHEKTPVLAIGAQIDPLDRWLLSASGAFAVVVPAASVDVLATVLEETLSFARMASGAVDPSRTHSHLRLACDHLDRLPIEAFLLLIAGAWSSGALPENALPALLDAARENGHDDDALAALERACEAPIPLVDVDVTDLFDDDRWYLYAFALWIALGTGEVIPRFSPTLQVMGYTLGVTARLRPLVQAIVERERRDGTGAGNTFRREDFQRGLLPELESYAGFSVRPPPPESAPAESTSSDEDVMEMPDDARIDDALVEAS